MIVTKSRYAIEEIGVVMTSDHFDRITQYLRNCLAKIITSLHVLSMPLTMARS
jgi:hypothetical protein